MELEKGSHAVGCCLQIDSQGSASLIMYIMINGRILRVVQLGMSTRVIDSSQTPPGETHMPGSEISPRIQSSQEDESPPMQS